MTNLRLPSLIGDNMVLQRGMRTPVWDTPRQERALTSSSLVSGMS